MRARPGRCGLLLKLVGVCLGAACVAAGEAPRPPAQPASGPGGAGYAHAGMACSHSGEGDGEYWLFEPADPRPGSAPVVVFNHGWGATGPWVYGAWIRHIVRRGNIVIFPRYQGSLLTPASSFDANAIGAVKDALERLDAGDHVRPQKERLAVVGHSAGALVAAGIAARAEAEGLPRPRAVMCVQPGRTWKTAGRLSVVIPLADVSGIHPDTLLLAVAGDTDLIVRDVDARRIVREATRVPARNKNFVLVRSDHHGRPALDANHYSPCAVDMALYRDIVGDEAAGAPVPAPRWGSSGAAGRRRRPEDTVNALDYYAYWKLFDALCDAAFYGRNRACALGGGAEQRDMGSWSDGRPVTPLDVTAGP